MRIILYPVFLLMLFLSCGKEAADKGSFSQDSLKVAQSSDSTGQTTLRLGDTSAVGERMPGASEVPIGKLPLLSSSVLAQFHPAPEGFYRYRSLAYDSSARTESVSFFRAKNDTTKILRCIIVDQDERTASTLIKQILEVKAQGYKEFDVNGSKVRAYYTEIKGVPAIHGYNPTTKVATLNVLCGDHRLVLFREDKATSSDHLISVANTMDLQRLTEMVPQ